MKVGGRDSTVPHRVLEAGATTTLYTWSAQEVMAACRSVSMSKARPLAGLPSFGVRLKPAAVRLKAAFRAALRPESADLAMAGPHPARGLKALLGCNPTLLAPALPDPEAPVIPRRFVQTAREGRLAKGSVRAFGGSDRKDIP